MHSHTTRLAERIVDAAPETLLQHLVASGNRASPSAGFVWDDPEAAAATGRIRGALNEARRFALLVHGAMLLYNLLLAERAEELGLTEHDGLRDALSTQLSDWRDEAEACDLGAWNLERLWALVAEQGRPVAVPTRSFVVDWLALIREQNGPELADSRSARTLVEAREYYQKRNQARLRNDRLISQWGGASGSDRLNFRWPVVRRLLNDIAEGRERETAGA